MHRAISFYSVPKIRCKYMVVLGTMYCQEINPTETRPPSDCSHSVMTVIVVVLIDNV